MSDEERDERKKKKVGSRLKKNKLFLVIFISSFVLIFGASWLLHHDFHIIGLYENDSGHANDVYVSGSYAYVADGYDGLEIIDISDPTTPIEVGQFDDGGNANDVYVSGSYAYVADGGDGLEIIDISNPAAPTKVGQFSGSAAGIYVSESYAYIISYDDGLEIIDISDPTAPTKVGQFNDDVSANDVYVSGSYAYVADGSDGLKIIDISDPTTPTEVGQFDDGVSAEDVYVSGSYAYIADFIDGLKIIDISDPTTPTKVGQFEDGDFTKGVYVSESYAYIVSSSRSSSSSSLKIIDISDPTTPVKVGQVGSDEFTVDVYVSESYAYMVNGDEGFEIIDPWSPNESISNVILWGIIIFLTFLVLGDLRYVIKEGKLFRNDYFQRRREKRSLGEKIGDPYKDGELKMESDIGLGLLLSIGIMIPYFSLIFFLFRDYDPFLYIPRYAISIIIYISIFIGFSISFFKKKRGYFAIGIIIPNLIVLLIIIVIFIFGLVTYIAPKTHLVKNSMVYLIILGSLSLSLGFSFLLLLKKYSKEQGDDPLRGEKMSREGDKKKRRVKSINKESLELTEPNIKSEVNKVGKKVFLFFSIAPAICTFMYLIFILPEEIRHVISDPVKIYHFYNLIALIVFWVVVIFALTMPAMIGKKLLFTEDKKRILILMPVITFVICVILGVIVYFIYSPFWNLQVRDGLPILIITGISAIIALRLYYIHISESETYEKGAI